MQLRDRRLTYRTESRILTNAGNGLLAGRVEETTACHIDVDSHRLPHFVPERALYALLLKLGW